jgi:hypothetical protein
VLDWDTAHTQDSRFVAELAIGQVRSRCSDDARFYEQDRGLGQCSMQMLIFAVPVPVMGYLQERKLMLS